MNKPLNKPQMGIVPGGRPRAPAIRLPRSSSLLSGRFQVVRHQWRGLASARLLALDFQEGGIPIELLWLPGIATCGDHLQSMRALLDVESPVMPQLYTTMRGEKACAAAFEATSGQPLPRHLGKHTMEPGQVIGAALSILDGLKEAHRLGVLDNDLSPESLRYTDSGEIRWLGAGLGWLLREEARCRGGSSALRVYNTPPGFTPSQHDLYSLGLCMYTMLTGATPILIGADALILPKITQIPVALAQVINVATQGYFVSPSHMSITLRNLSNDTLGMTAS